MLNIGGVAPALDCMEYLLLYFVVTVHFTSVTLAGLFGTMLPPRPASI
jgi:hypothetical protein